MIRAAIVLAAALAVPACGPRAVVAPSAPVSAATAADRLRSDLAAIFATPRFERSIWGVLVRPVDSTESLYELNAPKLMMPGSAMKIVTAAAAAELLGWEYRFETRIVSSAPIENGVLRGDLVVVGGGDPGISERSEPPGALRDIARRVRDAGISRIEGAIIGDDDLFDDDERGFGPGWTLDNIPYGYSAPVSALEYNEGSVDLVIRAGAAAGDPVVIQARPNGSGLEIENRLITVAESGTSRLMLRRNPGSPHLVVEGQIPARTAPFVRTASVDNPTGFFASAFREALLAEGVVVSGEAVDVDDLPAKPDLTGARTLAAHQSPPLRQLVSSMMKVSQNQYAEMLLRSLRSRLLSGAGEAGQPGTGRVRDVLRRWDVPDDSYVLMDGSGLSRYNYASSEALVRILQVMRRNPAHAPAFVDSLPVAGRDGTLARRLAGTSAEGRVRAKTGTVDNVRAIAGYVETADGETLVFSIIANNFTVSSSAIDEAADNALVRLAAFSRRSRNGGAVSAKTTSR